MGHIDQQSMAEQDELIAQSSTPTPVPAPPSSAIQRILERQALSVEEKRPQLDEKVEWSPVLEDTDDKAGTATSVTAESLESQSRKSSTASVTKPDIIEKLSSTAEQSNANEEQRTTLLQALIEQEKKLSNKKNKFTSTVFDHKMAKAHEAANTLIHDLETIRNKFIAEPEITLVQFKEEYSEIIHKAMPVLAKHRGWKPLLLNILNTLVSLGNIPLSYLTTKKIGFFKASTDSANKANDLLDCLNKIPNN